MRTVDTLLESFDCLPSFSLLRVTGQSLHLQQRSGLKQENPALFSGTDSSGI
ncbi:hypothetical protein [Desulforhopalus singaporensis]|uniref:hypothetical protein n=1 Tax=Desulforhopalus singaporensis TaxID=91360 RepID=UPI0015A27169|nr:hypothetical protein [Desulforhopalus singaporensis]